MDTATARRVLASIAAAIAACVGLSATAPSARADPETDIQAECESSAVGGIYSTSVVNHVSRSSCQYLLEGYAYSDNYENGAYTGTTVYRDGATVPTPKPTIPPQFDIADRSLHPAILPFQPAG